MRSQSVPDWIVEAESAVEMIDFSCITNHRLHTDWEISSYSYSQSGQFIEKALCIVEKSSRAIESMDWLESVRWRVFTKKL